MESPSAHEKPPERIKTFYKKYQRMTLTDLQSEQDVVDFVRDSDACSKHNLRLVRTIDSDALGSSLSLASITGRPSHQSGLIQVFESDKMPGQHAVFTRYRSSN